MSAGDEPAPDATPVADPASGAAAAAPRSGPPPGARTQQVLTWFALILCAVSVVWLVIAIVRDEPEAAPTPEAPGCVVQPSGCGLS